MSRHSTGSRDWWIETGLIAAGGFALAAWLWDGPIAERAELMEAAVTEDIPLRQPTLADMLEAGCLTSEHLQALRDGERVSVDCPVDRLQQQGPPEDRLFP